MQVSVAKGGTLELIAGGNVAVIFLVMSNELNTPKLLCCPEDISRTAATSFSSFGNQNLSYFVSLDASDTYPQMVISGDDNFTINKTRPPSGLVLFSTNDVAAWRPTRHVNQGNVGFGDGAVQGLASSRVRGALQNPGAATNRLVLP